MKFSGSFLLAFLWLILFAFKPVFSQYQVKSPYMTDPQLMIDFANDCAQFWIPTEDSQYGGFFADVDKYGTVTSSSSKYLVSQSRDLYGFTRAYMLSGNATYLEKAKSALNFMHNHFYDNTYGGWYSSTDRSGTSPNTENKTAFDQHYALLGLTAYYEATRDSLAYAMLQKGYDFNETYLWDNSPEQYGYFDYVSYTGTNPTGKSFNATVDAVTTHLYNLYLLTKDEKYAERLYKSALNMTDHLVESMDLQTIGFAELYHTDWSIDESETMTIMGHVLKTGWCLGRIYRINP